MTREHLHRCPTCRAYDPAPDHKCTQRKLRCPACRNRYYTLDGLFKHLQDTGHKACDCGHGRWHPHRPGTPGCVHEPWDDVFGIPRGKILPTGAPCPF